MPDFVDNQTGEVFDVTMTGIEHSPSIGAIAAALAKAQGRIQNAAKDSVNPHFKSKYADLASVWDACRDALSANAISVVQSPYNGQGGSVGVLTMLAHESGEWMKSSIHAKPRDITAQSVGSVITYLRRYSLSAMTGVAPVEDDDGNAASGRVTNNNGENNRAQIQKPDINADEIAEFEGMVSAKLAEVSGLEALDELWHNGINRALRDIGQIDPSARKRIIDLFSQRKNELKTSEPKEAAA